MVHELLGIVDNRVDMRSVPNVAPELQDIVLSPHQDRFFADALHYGFGEMGSAVKGLVSAYQVCYHKSLNA